MRGKLVVSRMEQASGRSVRVSCIEVAVGVLVIERRILLVQRSPRMEYGPFLWGCFGGKIEPGESIYAALAREAREEIGLDVEPVFPTFVSVTEHRPPETKIWCVITAMRVTAGAERIADVTIRHADEEVCGFGWFSADELIRLRDDRRLTAAGSAGIDGLLRALKT